MDEVIVKLKGLQWDTEKDILGQSCLLISRKISYVDLQRRARDWWPESSKMLFCIVEYRVDRKIRLQKPFAVGTSPLTSWISLWAGFSETLSLQEITLTIMILFGASPSLLPFPVMCHRSGVRAWLGFVRAVCYPFASKLIWKPELWINRDST